MNWIDKLIAWLRGRPATAQSPPPTIGDRLLLFVADQLKARTTEAKQKANAANAAAPADNAPGATNEKSDAPLGQTLSDLLKANGQ